MSSVSSADLSNRAGSILAGLPLFFEPNQGQFSFAADDARARFVNRGSGYTLFLGAEGAILGFASHDPQKKRSRRTSETSPAARLDFVGMKLAGANPNAVLRPIDPLPGKSNYFIGNDESKWRHGIPHFARVGYENVYPGINLVFYGKQGQLEYDFQVSPGADPSQAELEFQGARRIELNAGALTVATEHGNVRLEVPRVYQEINGKQQAIDAKFVLKAGNRAGFLIGSYDRSRELIIDPTLNFATYFGGSGDEHASSVAVDGSLNIYLAGSTTSPDLPVTAGCLYKNCGALTGAQNVYIAKLTPPLGSVAAALEDVTYLGGTGTETPVGIAVDGGLNPYVAGTTSSTDFPTTSTNAYQKTIYPNSTGTAHVFVTRLTDDFTQLSYSSYLSGNGTDTASGMAIDASGDLYVTGTTTSTNTSTSSSIQFPASSTPEKIAFQQSSNSTVQFFVTEVYTAGTNYGSIVYSTYFGGANFNQAPAPAPTGPTAIGGGIAVDASSNIYFTGTTNFTYTGGCGTGGCATDFPIVNAYQPCLDLPPTAVVLNPQSCTVSNSNFQSDAFVAKLNINLTGAQQLVWSTYVGGEGDDSSTGVALDLGAANVYVVGTTNSNIFVSPSLVSTYASYQKCLDNQPYSNASTAVSCTNQPYPGPTDAFVARLTNPTTNGTTSYVALNYFSYLGGGANEGGSAIVADASSGAVITGYTESSFTASANGTFPLFPNPSSIGVNQLTGTRDAFIARLNTAAAIGQSTTASWATYYGGATTNSGASASTNGTGIGLDVNQGIYVVGDTNSGGAGGIPTAKPLQASNAGTTGDTYDAFVTQLGTAFSLSIQGQLTLGTNQTFISAGNPATFTYTITNNGPDLANNVTVLANMTAVQTVIPLTNISASISAGTCGGGATTSGSISCGPISLQSGSTATLTITASPTANSSGKGGDFNGGTIQVLAPGNIVVAQTSVSAHMSDFGMEVTPQNLTIPQAGSPAQFNVQLTPSPLYNAAISLSCTGQPSGTTCDFSPGSSITLQGSSGATATMTIPTVARPATPSTGSLLRRQFYALWLVIPGLALLGAGSTRRRRIAGLFVLFILLGSTLFLPSCSHGVTQTPPAGTQAGTYTVTVTAASGTDSKSQTVTLNVP